MSNHQDKKAAILKAASQCFARYGYEKTTLDDIGGLVGLNKASLYYYYKNKESLFTEVIFSEAEAFLNRLIASIEKVQGCKEKIMTYLSQRAKYLGEAVNLSQLTNESIAGLTPLFAGMYAAIEEKEIACLSEILSRSMASGEFIPCDGTRVARSILTVSAAILNRYEVCSDKRSADIITMAISEIDFTVSLILEGLKIK
jgi:AcrR family transcriptional regulator